MRLRRALPLVGALSLVAAACAGGASPTPGGGTPVAPSPGAATGTPAAPTGSPETGGEAPDELVLGLVPSREADVLIENAVPLTDHLSQELGIPVEGFVPQDYTGLVAAMETGQAHIGAFGPFALIQARDRAGAEIILQSVRFGSPTYHTQWMTNDPDKYCTDEPVADEDGFLGCNGTVDASEGPAGEDTLADVAGATVSFVEQSSASGYIFPAVQLINAGIDHETGIEPIFSGGHDNSVIAVYQGDAEVGVSFDDARSIVAEEFADVGEKVVVFAYSQEIPNDGVAVAGDLPDELKQQIQDVLIAYAQTEEGAQVLDSIYEISEFAPADQEAFGVVEEAAAELGITSD